MARLGRSLLVAIIAFYCRLAGSLAPITVSARCHATGQRAPSVRMEEHEGKRVHAARWQQYAAGAFTPPAPLGRAGDSPSPDSQGMLPPALRAWVERSFAQCTEDDEHSIVEREFLQRVAQGGLELVDWDSEPLIDMRTAPPSGSEPPWRRPAPAAVPTHTDGGRAAGAAEREMLTDETLAARLQPRLSHKEQMARLAEAAHAAEARALAMRSATRRLETDGASAVAAARQVVGRARDVEQASARRAREMEARLAARTAGAGRQAGRQAAFPPGVLRPAPPPTSVSSTGHSIRIRDRREMKP